MDKTLLTALIALVVVLNNSIQGQITYTGGTYTQNFDTLASTGTNNPWTNNVTLPGWYLFRQPSPGTPLNTYNASDGSNNAGSFYSFGSVGSNERALGAIGSGGAYWGNPGSGATAGWMAVAFTINTPAAVNSFTISYTGEQWRDANTNAQDLQLEWGVGATFGGVATWTAPGGTFNFTSPQTSGTAGALDGNLAANRVTNLGGTVNTTLNIGDTLWIRWRVLNAPGNDHGLAIDDFSFSTTLIPEPQHYAIFLAVLLALVILIRRRAKSDAPQNPTARPDQSLSLTGTTKVSKVLLSTATSGGGFLFTSLLFR